MRTRVGIAGIGRWGKNLVRVFDKVAEVAACAGTGGRENRTWLRENYPDVRYLDYETMVKDDQIDAVVIATPIETHFDLSRLALEHGKHVFVEKPLARSAVEAQRLVDLARVRGLTLFVGYVYLYHPAFRILARETKPLHVLDLLFQWEKFGTFGESLELNLLTHDVAIAMSLAGPLESHDMDIKHGFVSDLDIVSLRMTHEGGAKSTVQINRLSPRRRKRLTVITRDIVWVWENDELFRWDGGSRFDQVLEVGGSPLHAECLAFLGSVERGDPSPTDGDFGLQVMKSTPWVSSKPD